jgi:hypothetical protein
MDKKSSVCTIAKRPNAKSIYTLDFMDERLPTYVQYVIEL